MNCPKCKAEMIISSWGGWRWMCCFCDHYGIEATTSEWNNYILELRDPNKKYNRILDGMKERQGIIDLYHWVCPFCGQINDYEDIDCTECLEFDRRLIN